MASCVRNICTKNYHNLIIGQVTVENVGDTFLRHSVYGLFNSPNSSGVYFSHECYFAMPLYYSVAVK